MLQNLKRLKELRRYDIKDCGTKSYKIFPCSSDRELKLEHIQAISCIREIKIDLDQDAFFAESSTSGHNG